MSKIGKKQINIPEGVNLSVDENFVFTKKGDKEIKIPILSGVKCILSEDSKSINFEIVSKTKQYKSNWGTMRSLVNNAVLGVVSGFEKTLILEGVGYRVAKEGEGLILNLGFSHPVKYEAVKGISFEIEKNSIIKIKGIDKMLVGKVAAEIRKLKKPEPYKGKGFHYSDEVIRRKSGKKGTGSS